MARSLKNGIVVYTDIRKFYPSIPAETARQAWHDTAKSCQLPGLAERLGQRLLDNHSAVEDSNAHGILTGPMFSHVVGNLVLRNIDSEMRQILPDGYFRYVDDFALVGKRRAVIDAEKRLADLLDDIGLSVNRDKRLEVSTRDWLVGADDFMNEHHPVSWMTFVGGMKQLLITKPALAKTLKDNLEVNGFRISPLNYSDAVRERRFIRRFYELHLKRWYQSILRNLNPHDLIVEAIELRSRYEGDFETAINGSDTLEGFERKRRIHRLRRLCSRLIYLASPKKLRHIATSLAALPEMALYSAVFDALDRRDISNLLPYGANAAHSVAQALLSSRPPLKCTLDDWTDASRQARAVFVAHGFSIDGSSPVDASEMEQFCAWKGHSITGPGPSSTYFGELITLHGFGECRRHDELLAHAYDIDDEVVLDMGTLLEQSY
ncbi:MAG: RNA-directed DNA polymerase [Candidatus Hydrogenedentes bacterium]|nr:RNA-directed DNA polymerase [Candidatus Hydrogenedentota bacterium]